MLLSICSKATQLTHGWCQVPPLLHPHIVAAAFLSHWDRAAIMQCNGKMEKRHFTLSFIPGKIRHSRRYTVCHYRASLLNTLCSSSEVAGLRLALQLWAQNVCLGTAPCLGLSWLPAREIRVWAAMPHISPSISSLRNMNPCQTNWHCHWHTQQQTCNAGEIPQHAPLS